MCGFVGYVGKLNKNLEASASQILHRGPDKSSFITEDDFSVAFNRLSIIDLTETGMQPYKYKNIIAYLNGEIYNYLELQKKFKNEFKPKFKLMLSPHLDTKLSPFFVKTGTPIQIDSKDVVTPG